jgi:hypothetical protein
MQGIWLAEKLSFSRKTLLKAVRKLAHELVFISYYYYYYYYSAPRHAPHPLPATRLLLLLLHFPQPMLWPAITHLPNARGRPQHLIASLARSVATCLVTWHGYCYTACCGLTRNKEGCILLVMMMMILTVTVVVTHTADWPSGLLWFKALFPLPLAGRHFMPQPPPLPPVAVLTIFVFDRNRQRRHEHQNAFSM